MRPRPCEAKIRSPHGTADFRFDIISSVSMQLFRNACAGFATGLQADEASNLKQEPGKRYHRRGSLERWQHDAEFLS